MSHAAPPVDLATLRAKFAPVLKDGITIKAGQLGLPLVVVDTPACQGHVYLYGAHVSHFQPAKQKPVLFMSEVPLTPGGAFRGGVPVCFPWFAIQRPDFPNKGPKTPPPRHGFARIRPWDLVDLQRVGDEVIVRLALYADASSHEYWPFDFSADYVVRFGRELQMSLTVHNLDVKPFVFEEALHSYFAVSEVKNVKLDGPRWARDFVVDRQIDFIQHATPDTVTLHDAELNRSISVEKTGSNSTVVWFPWMPEPGKSTVPDMTQPESRTMLCIETANAGPESVTLQPGAKHTMRARVSVGRL
jgi:glucose-6-phosphate 1-epimerase